MNDKISAAHLERSAYIYVRHLRAKRAVGDGLLPLARPEVSDLRHMGAKAPARHSAGSSPVSGGTVDLPATVEPSAAPGAQAHHTGRPGPASTSPAPSSSHGP